MHVKSVVRSWLDCCGVGWIDDRIVDDEECCSGAFEQACICRVAFLEESIDEKSCLLNTRAFWT